MAVALQQRHERVIAALQQAARSAAMTSSTSLTSSTVTSRLPPLHAAAKRDDVELAASLLQRTAVRRQPFRLAEGPRDAPCRPAGVVCKTWCP